MRRVAIFGSTGSIGRSTLEVLALHPERFEVFALGAKQRDDLLLEQCLRFSPRYAVLSEAAAAQRLRLALQAHGSATEVLQGDAAHAELAAADETDIVMAAIVGAAGLASSLAAARAGKRVLLANKESLVVAGALFMQAVQQGGGNSFRSTANTAPSCKACRTIACIGPIPCVT